MYLLDDNVFKSTALARHKLGCGKLQKVFEFWGSRDLGWPPCKLHRFWYGGTAGSQGLNGPVNTRATVNVANKWKTGNPRKGIKSEGRIFPK